jgi:hypothetical protein
MKIQKEPQTWLDSLDKRPKLKNMVTRFSTWNVRSLYRASLLVTESEELSKCKFDLVGVQEVGWRWYRTSRRIHIFLWKRNENH